MNIPEDRDLTLSRFREGPVRLEQTIRGLRDAELDLKPCGGGWSIRQIVHHIADGDDIWKLGVKLELRSRRAAANTANNDAPSFESDYCYRVITFGARE